MILDEKSIIERLMLKDKERLVITPIIDAVEQFQPSSIDLRLGSHFKIIRTSEFAFFDPLCDEEEIRSGILRSTEDVDKKILEPFVLHPSEFVLGSTLEYIKLPSDIAARLEGRSSWARMGLVVHSTGGFIDPGFAGSITFELCNTGKIPFALYSGLRIAQISFYQLKQESMIPYEKKAAHKYQGDIRPTSSKVYKDIEIDIFKRLKKKRNNNP